MNPPSIAIGDMQVVGAFPPKAVKALAVIAFGLHDFYDGLADVESPGFSKQACVFSALAAGEFLRAIGFDDAIVQPCDFLARAERGGNVLRMIRIGDRTVPERPHFFNGHAVVLIPSIKLLVDVALYPAIRPEFDGVLSGMLAVELNGAGREFEDRAALAGAQARLDNGGEFFALWAARPDIELSTLLDFKDPRSVRRRREIVGELVKTFGSFTEDGRLV